MQLLPPGLPGVEFPKYSTTAPIALPYPLDRQEFALNRQEVCLSSREEFELECQGICTARGWIFEPGVVEIPCANGRRQRVNFAFFTFEDLERVRLHSVIGSTRKIDGTRLNTALSLNFRLPDGALAVHKDDLVLVDTLMLQEADGDVIAAAFAYLAETADHYEKTMFGPDVS